MKKILILILIFATNILAEEVSVVWDVDNAKQNMFFKPLNNTIKSYQQYKYKHKQKVATKNFSNSSTPATAKMIDIFGGCLPQKDISLEWKCTNDFSISNTEVTNAQYRNFKPKHNSNSNNLLLNDDNQPVVNITLVDANNYALWLSKKTGEKYSLPTNTEWQYAANTGLAKQPWNDLNICEYANFRDDENCADNAKNSNMVASYRPNKWGLYDMFGNIWEMVESNKPIAKGGSWYSSKGWSNGHFDYKLQTKKSPDVGFRLIIRK